MNLGIDIYQGSILVGSNQGNSVYLFRQIFGVICAITHIYVKSIISN